MSGTLTERRFTYTSGSGSDQYAFVVYVDPNSHLFIVDIVTPTGSFNFDSSSLPQSVVVDMNSALTEVAAML